MTTTTDEAQAELRWGDEARMVDALTRPPSPGLAVACTDAFAGRVISTTLDKAGWPCSVVVRLKGLWGRQVDVPASWIESADYVQADRAWRPPYPFTAADCLWARS